jgi:hypothetical protein
LVDENQMAAFDSYPLTFVAAIGGLTGVSPMTATASSTAPAAVTTPAKIIFAPSSVKFSSSHIDISIFGPGASTGAELKNLRGNKTHNPLRSKIRALLNE